MAYLPKNKIKTDLYASGKQFVYQNTTDFYIGLYYALYNGKFYTGQDQTTPNSKEIIKFEPFTNNIASSKSIGLAQSPLFPTDQDYKNGFFNRYFLLKVTYPLFIETDKKTYNTYEQRSPQVPWPLYNPLLITWQLTGDINQVAQTNKNSILIVEQQNTALGLSLYLKDNYTQYYKFPTSSNLYTAGGEFKTANRQNYIGFYHIHDKTGPMVGAVHTKTSHELLFPINETIISQTMNQPPKTLTQTPNNYPSQPSSAGGGGGGGGGGGY